MIRFINMNERGLFWVFGRQSWSCNTRNSISFSDIKIYFKYLMAPFEFTNDQNTIRRFILDYINILKIKVHLKDDAWNSMIFIIILKPFTKFVG